MSTHTVQYTYKDRPRRSYRVDAEVYVLAKSFDDASETVKQSFPDIHPEGDDFMVVGVQHRGEKTFLWSDTALDD